MDPKRVNTLWRRYKAVFEGRLDQKDKELREALKLIRTLYSGEKIDDLSIIKELLELAIGHLEVAKKHNEKTRRFIEKFRGKMEGELNTDPKTLESFVSTLNDQIKKLSDGELEIDQYISLLEEASKAEQGIPNSLKDVIAGLEYGQSSRSA